MMIALSFFSTYGRVYFWVLWQRKFGKGNSVLSDDDELVCCSAHSRRLSDCQGGSASIYFSSLLVYSVFLMLDIETSGRTH